MGCVERGFVAKFIETLVINNQSNQFINHKNRKVTMSSLKEDKKANAALTKPNPEVDASRKA